mmetsp:Transcript_3074/g.11137  ORF Transcript_3074/g.11137 Transcript_3074/m.11137 type:complete len:607 (+) Transcript_3074:791-2611(+)
MDDSRQQSRGDLVVPRQAGPEALGQKDVHGLKHVRHVNPVVVGVVGVPLLDLQAELEELRVVDLKGLVQVEPGEEVARQHGQGVAVGALLEPEGVEEPLVHGLQDLRDGCAGTRLSRRSRGRRLQGLPLPLPLRLLVVVVVQLHRGVPGQRPPHVGVLPGAKRLTGDGLGVGIEHLEQGQAHLALKAGLVAQQHLLQPVGGAQVASPQRPLQSAELLLRGLVAPDDALQQVDGLVHGAVQVEGLALVPVRAVKLRLQDLVLRAQVVVLSLELQLQPLGLLQVGLVHQDCALVRHGVPRGPHLELHPPVLLRVPPLGHLELNPKGLELLDEENVPDVVHQRRHGGVAPPYPLPRRCRRAVAVGVRHCLLVTQVGHRQDVLQRDLLALLAPDCKVRLVEGHRARVGRQQVARGAEQKGEDRGGLEHLHGPQRVVEPVVRLVAGRRRADQRIVQLGSGVVHLPVQGLQASQGLDGVEHAAVRGHQEDVARAPDGDDAKPDGEDRPHHRPISVRRGRRQRGELPLRLARSVLPGGRPPCLGGEVRVHVVRQELVHRGFAEERDHGLVAPQRSALHRVVHPRRRLELVRHFKGGGEVVLHSVGLSALHCHG